jgi:hypothetical protein
MPSAAKSDLQEHSRQGQSFKLPGAGHVCLLWMIWFVCKSHNKLPGFHHAAQVVLLQEHVQLKKTNGDP